MRCPDCNKFVGNEPQDPEMSDESYADGEVTGSCRIVLACSDCGTELKEASLDVSVPADFCKGNDHEVDIEVAGLEALDRREGKGRRYRTFYGAECDFNLSCSCGKKLTVHWQDDIQSSHMDEM